MRTFLFLLCGLLLAVLTLSGLAAKGAKGGKHQAAAKPDPLAIYVTGITQACQSTDDQQKAISAKLQAAQTDLQAYDAKNKDNETDLNGRLKDARMVKDKTRVQEISAQLKQIKDGRDAIVTQFHKDVLALLTPEQQQAFAANQLLQQIKTYFAKATLTDDQIAKIKPLCADAAKAIAALPATDTRGTAKLQHDLLVKINNTILTDDQRGAMLPPLTMGDQTTTPKRTPKIK